MTTKRAALFLWFWSYIVLFGVDLRAEESSQPPKRLFLWKVKSDKATAYLLGSMHLAKPDLYPLPEKIEKAFEQSDTLVVEVNVATNELEVAALMMAKAAYPAGDNIEKHVSKEVLDSTGVRLEKLGVPVAQIKQLKPWFLAMMMSVIEMQKLGVVPQNGIDIHFLGQAKGHKQIQELESVNAQLNLLDGFTDEEQELFLKYTTKDLDNLAKDFDVVSTAWINGDVKGVEAFTTKALKEDPGLAPVFKKFLEDRNKVMAAKIEEWLKQEHTYFIVVGAAHLVGDNGLIKLLGKNHKVEQLSR